jgi:hypothetical protein
MKNQPSPRLWLGKRPSAALPSSFVNDVPYGTPYSSGFRAPCIWAFLISLKDEGAAVPYPGRSKRDRPLFRTTKDHVIEVQNVPCYSAVIQQRIRQ